MVKRPPQPKSRAAIRQIEAGNAAECEGCGERVKFQARVKAQQIICNLYRKGEWVGVVHYHEDCYTDLGEPYGTPEERPSTKDEQKLAPQKAAIAAETMRLWDEARAQGVHPGQVALPHLVQQPHTETPVIPQNGKM